MSEYTKTPWDYYVATMGGDDIAVIHPKGEPDDYRICTVFDEAGHGSSPEANARHIVHCVNNYESLVEMVRDLDTLFCLRHGCFPLDRVTPEQRQYNDVMTKARALLAALEAEKGGE